MSQAAVEVPQFSYAVGFTADLRSGDDVCLFPMPVTIFMRGDVVERIALPAYWRDMVEACGVPYEHAEGWLLGEVIRQARGRKAL
jgi:hypothetical protein